MRAVERESPFAEESGSITVSDWKLNGVRMGVSRCLGWRQRALVVVKVHHGVDVYENEM